jgi:HK97 family phage portal protein
MQEKQNWNIFQKIGLQLAFGKRAMEVISTISHPDKWLVNILTGNVTSDSGVEINEVTAMKSSAVIAAVKILSGTIASLPLNVYKQDGRDKFIDISHPLYNVLHYEANPEMTSYQFREMAMYQLCHYGNFYAEIQRDNAARVIALWPLLSKNVVVRRDTNLNLIYDVFLPDGTTAVLPSDKVLHIPALSRNGLVGLSPLQMLSEVIGLNLATQKFGNKFFANGAWIGGVLEHPKKLDTEPYQRLKNSIKEQYQGLDNSNRMIILEEGMKYNQTAVPPETAQFLQTRKFSVTDIARAFRVPPHMIGDLERSTFSNIEHQGIEFVTHSVMPWVVCWEQEIRRKLFLSFEKEKYFVKFLVDGLLRGDVNARYNAYKTGIQNGWLSPNEVREKEDMNPREGGDIYLTPTNMNVSDKSGQISDPQETKEITEGGDTANG